MDLKEIEFEDMKWTCLAYDGVQWWVLVSSGSI